MTRWVEPGAEFGELFATFRQSAWRWESQGTYREPYESVALARFLRGEELDTSYLQGWLDDVRAATRAGRRFERVRLLTEPLTDYLRFELAVTLANVAAGEDIRVLPPDAGALLGLPDHDFWIFDDREVATLKFGPDGLLGAEIDDDPATLARHRQWRDLAWSEAIPFETYWASAHL